MIDEHSNKEKTTFDQGKQSIGGGQNNIAGDLKDEHTQLGSAEAKSTSNVTVNNTMPSYIGLVLFLVLTIVILIIGLVFVLIRNDNASFVPTVGETITVIPPPLETWTPVPTEAILTNPATQSAYPISTNVATNLESQAAIPDDVGTTLPQSTPLITSSEHVKDSVTQLQFHDSFENGFSTKWLVTGIAVAKDGKLMIDEERQTSGFNEVLLLVGENYWTNYRVSVNLDLIGQPLEDEEQFYRMNREVIVIFNEDITKDEFQGFSFKNSSEEMFSPAVYQYQGTNVPRLEPAFSVATKGKPQFHIELEVRSDTVTVTVDNSLLGKRSLPTLSRGRAGIILKVYGAKTQSPTVDNFLIEPLES